MREQAALSNEAREQLLGALSRLDRRSKVGPWTEATLAAIATHPGRRAAELASTLGRETDWLKSNVRKLKDLGLTESLETGYHLSPRGRAMLESLHAED
jgi:predicted transcriptional regulator